MDSHQSSRKARLRSTPEGISAETAGAVLGIKGEFKRFLIKKNEIKGIQIILSYIKPLQKYIYMKSQPMRSR